jgi:hypothetical protein
MTEGVLLEGGTGIVGEEIEFDFLSPFQVARLVAFVDEYFTADKGVNKDSVVWSGADSVGAFDVFGNDSVALCAVVVYDVRERQTQVIHCFCPQSTRIDVVLTKVSPPNQEEGHIGNVKLVFSNDGDIVGLEEDIVIRVKCPLPNQLVRPDSMVEAFDDRTCSAVIDGVDEDIARGRFINVESVPHAVSVGREVFQR